MWAEQGLTYEDLVVGWTHESDGFTITPGHTAWFQAFGGDQNPSHRRGAKVAESPVNTTLLAHIAIGDSTVATREVIANLYYRDVIFHAPALSGTTVRTRVTVVGREGATPRPDRPPRGKVMLHIVLRDEDDREVLSMHRFALMPAASTTGDSAPMSIPVLQPEVLDAATSRWRHVVDDQPSPDDWAVGVLRRDHLMEPVVDALGLVRLTGNEARAHRDPAMGQGSRRLVYGGHTLSLAQAAVSRLVDTPHVVIAWNACEHPAPVFENDLLSSEATLAERLTVGKAQLLTLDVSTSAQMAGDEPRLVQHWQPRLLVAGSRAT
jgi:2-methylfumaryl-CoA hydratase